MSILITQNSERFVKYQNKPEINRLLFKNINYANSDEVKDIAYGAYPNVAPSDPSTIAGFNDGAENIPVKDLVVQIIPSQEGSGDPSPDNIRQISGWTGVKIERTGENIWGGTLFRDGILGAIPGATYDDETIRVYANSTVNVAFTKASGLNDKFKENTVYTLILTGYNANSSSSSSNIRVNYTDGTYSTLAFPSTEATKQTLVFTTPADKTLRSITKTNQASYSVFYYNECGLFEGAITEQDFKPYIGKEYAISWEDEAGTVYGGSLNVTNGILSVDTVFMEITKITRFSDSTATGYAIIALGEFGSVVDSDIICNMLKKQKVTSNTDENIITVFNSEGYNRAQITFRLTDSLRASTVTETQTNYETYLQHLKDNGTPLTVAYKLATPVIYQITPTEVNTLLGVNNIWGDTGNVSVDYRADTTLYIENILNPTGTAYATENIESGKYFIANNKLYISTAIIAQGDAIVPGTNCTETNVAEALNLLNS